MLEQSDLLAATTAPLEEIELLLNAEHSDPFHVLGAHIVEWEEKPAVAVRAYLPGAEQVWVRRDSELFPSQRIHADGFFEAVFPNEAQVFPYRLRASYGEGNEPEF